LREEHYLWVGKRCYLVLHGDQFDRSLRMTRLGDIADNFYNLMLRNCQPVAYWLKSSAKRYGGVDEVRRRAADYARNNGCQGVILGHTHYQEEQIIDSIHCLNTGSWMDQPYTYVRVEEDRLQLCHWPNHAYSRNGLEGADRRPSRNQAPH
jgi:UDP-2,3-diacylglucosamine pyrophosphatase LpxH